MEIIEGCIRNWLDFKEVKFNSDYELLLAMEEVGNRKEKLKMSDKE